MPEKTVQNDILEAVGGRPYVRLWRQNTGAAQFTNPATGEKQWVRFGMKGQPDLTGVLRCGRRAEVEVKSATGRRTPEQERYATMAAAFGCFYVLARSVQDVEAALADHLKGCPTCVSADVYAPTPVRG